MTWMWVSLAVVGLIAAFVLGDSLDPLSPAAHDRKFDRAILICTQAETLRSPDGIFREDLGLHFAPENVCLLIASQMGRWKFSEKWNDPTYVEMITRSRGT